MKRGATVEFGSKLIVDAVGHVREDAHRLVQMSWHKGPGQHRDSHKDSVSDELELHPPSLDIQVIEHLGGSRPTRDIVYHCREDHHLLAIPRSSEKQHGRADSDRYIALSVAVAAGLSAGSYALFATLLRVPLPLGPLGW